MLYYLDTKPGGSWADRVLSKLGYDKRPEKLQQLLRTIYERGVKQIKLEGTAVVSVPLYEALDGSNTKDYVQRVEPSSQGGRKLAELIVDRIKEALTKLPREAQTNLPKQEQHGAAQMEASRSEATVSMPPPTHVFDRVTIG